MKKRKLRESLHGIPMEWPKTMSLQMMRTMEQLPADAVVSVVCEWEDFKDIDQTRAVLSAARKQTQEREHSITLLTQAMFVIKATLRFIQCLLAHADVRAINISHSDGSSFSIKMC